MKKLVVILAILLAATLSACTTDNNTKNPTEKPDSEVVNIELWSFPIGEWNENVNVSSILAAFNKTHPHIHVETKTISYETGDAEVEAALSKGTAPDIIFEGPERLVANWGARGLMADLSDLFDDNTDLIPQVKAACLGKNGYNIYPLCMTTHCMAINREMFEEAGAWQYVDEEKHVWTTDGFIAAVNALYSNGITKVASVFCGSQAGDQGTRALVNNLYGGKFVNDDHTAYIVDSPENIRALNTLIELNGIDFDPTIGGGDAINAFNNGETAMTFCWNISAELTHIKNSVNVDFDIFPIAFPSVGVPALQGGIWGMGIFDNGDADKIEASKTFIRYLVEQKYEDTVVATGFLPVVNGLDFYENDALRTEYGIFSKYLGDYYQISPNWANARTEWWKMLQNIGNGEDIAQSLKLFCDKVNKSE